MPERRTLWIAAWALWAICLYVNPIWAFIAIASLFASLWWNCRLESNDA